jgi:hypothetical protein
MPPGYSVLAQTGATGQATPTMPTTTMTVTITIAPPQVAANELARMRAANGAPAPPVADAATQRAYWQSRRVWAQAAMRLIDRTAPSWPAGGFAQLDPPSAQGQRDYWRAADDHAVEQIALLRQPLASQLHARLVGPRGYFASHPRAPQVAAAIDRVASSPDAHRINCYVRDIGNALVS